MTYATTTVGARVAVPVDNPWFQWRVAVVAVATRGPKHYVDVVGAGRARVFKVATFKCPEAVDADATMDRTQWLWKQHRRGTPMRLFEDAMRDARQ